MRFENGGFLFRGEINLTNPFDPTEVMEHYVGVNYIPKNNYNLEVLSEEAVLLLFKFPKEIIDDEDMEKNLREKENEKKGLDDDIFDFDGLEAELVNGNGGQGGD